MLDPTKKNTPCVQGQRRLLSKMVGGVKSRLESNPISARDAQRLKQTLCAPQHRDPTETEPELGLSVSCRGTGQQWTSLRAAALGAADLGMALALLEEVAIYPTIEPPGLTQDMGNRLLEGTNKTVCAPGPRDPTETEPGLCLRVSCRGMGGMGQQ